MDSKTAGLNNRGVCIKMVVILLCVFFVGFFVIGINFQYTLQTLYLGRKYNYSTSSSVNYSKYIVHTRTCSIPRFNPRDPKILHAIKDNLRPIDCGLPDLTSMVNRRLIINIDTFSKFGVKNMSDVKCCMQTICRDQSDDDVIISPNCSKIENGTIVKEEFVRVSCTLKKRKNVVEYHFTIPPSDLTEEFKDRKYQKTPWNVMAIGLDSISRLNFERHLPKTRKYLLESMKAVEMFGYTKMGDNTFPNLVAALGGMSQKEMQAGCWKDEGSFDSCTSWIWDKFSQKGYKTLYGEDSYRISTFNYIKEGFYYQPTDYYLRPYLIAAEKETARTKFMNTKLCLGAKPMHQVTLNWGAQFMKLMKDVPYYGFLWSNSLTHDNGDMVQIADDYLSKTLKDLHANGYLKRTVVFVISDHGIRWGPIRNTEIGSYENRLPALYVFLPEDFRKEKRNLYDNLRTNSRRLTSPYDVYHTFLHILGLSTNYSIDDEEGYPTYGTSLLETVPEERTCDDAGIDSEWCACDETVDLDISDPLVTSMAVFVVQWINDALKDVMNKCAWLTLKTVIKASQQRNVLLRDNENQSSQYYYRVTLNVEPSRAIFEATVKSENDTKGNKSMDGDVTRLNLYGHQSDCVDDVAYKTFCYCLS